MPESARTATDRSLQGRIAAYDSWANTPDRSARTAPARAAFQRRFEDQVDPERVLPEQVRAHMAEAARNAFYTRLARQGLEARRKKNQNGKVNATKAAPAERPSPSPTTTDATRGESASR